MTASQDKSTRLYINIGAVDVTSVAYQDKSSRMYVNFGVNKGFIVIPAAGVALGQVLDEGATLVPIEPDHYTRLYIEITA